MFSMGIKIGFVNHEAVIESNKLKLKCKSFSHYCIRLKNLEKFVHIKCWSKEDEGIETVSPVMSCIERTLSETLKKFSMCW